MYLYPYNSICLVISLIIAIPRAILSSLIHSSYVNRAVQKKKRHFLHTKTPPCQKTTYSKRICKVYEKVVPWWKGGSCCWLKQWAVAWHPQGFLAKNLLFYKIIDWLSFCICGLFVRWYFLNGGILTSSNAECRSGINVRPRHGNDPLVHTILLGYKYI